MKIKSSKKSLKLFHKVIFILNLAAIMALILSYAASWISPETFWPLAFFGLVYPALFFINLVFVGYWLFFSRQKMLYSLVAILLGIGLSNRFVQLNEQKSAEELEQHSKIITYNVHSYARSNWDEKGDNSFTNRFISFFSAQNPDVLCLQEHLAYGKTEREIRKKLRKKTNLNHYYLKKYYNTYDKSQCIGIFSRHPIISYGMEQMDWKGKERTFFIYGDIAFPEDTIRVYSTHLQSNYLDKEFVLFTETPEPSDSEYQQKLKKNSISILRKLKYAYQERAKQSKELKKHIQKSPHPVVLCGDFNDTPASYAYGQLNKELTDVYRESGSGNSRTYHGNFPSARIDYIFRDEELKSANTKVIQKNWSDHYPVITHIKMKDE